MVFPRLALQQSAPFFQRLNSVFKIGAVLILILLRTMVTAHVHTHSKLNNTVQHRQASQADSIEGLAIAS